MKMAENENLNNDVVNEPTDTNVDYIEAINNLKKNSVPKDDYEKLKAENKKLLNSIINGDQLPTDIKSNEPSIADLREELYGGEGFKGSDIEGWQKTLQLRKKIIEEDGYDPFVPQGRQATPTASDYEVADRVASVVSDCIEYAQGDNALFISELNRRTTGTALDRITRK